jgi:3-deoxy-D-manno-octulosonic-acid transferase
MILYNIVLTFAALLAMPLALPIVLRVKKRRTTVLERLGLRGLPRRPDQSGPCRKRIWVHALSVGEVTSAAPLVQRLRRRFPERDIFFSTSTRTGFQTARRLVSAEAAALFYFPYDLWFSVARVVRRVSPEIMVIVETDLWPNFLHTMARRAVPVFLVNARISRRSCDGYRRLSFLTRPAFKGLRRVVAPSPADARRWVTLGVPAGRIVETGNIKFDQHAPEISRAECRRLQGLLKIPTDGTVLVAGSTHEGEEAILAHAFHQLKAACNGLCFVLAPRDPDRAAAVRRTFLSAGVAATTMAELDRGGAAAEAVVVDRIGLLSTLYALADLAFVGGSLVARGGHNPIEPAVLGVPVLFGPHMSDFREIADLLVASGGAMAVPDGPALADAARPLLADAARREAMGRAGRRTVVSHRGAVDRTVALIAEALAP